MRTDSLKTAQFQRLFARKPLGSTLRMAPLIDIIFLLLIFFLVCAKWRPEERLLPLQLTAAGAAETPIVKAEPLIIRINHTGTGCIVRIGPSADVRITTEQTEQDLAALLRQLRDTLSAQNRYASDPVEIICDANVEWDYFAGIYNILYGAGLTDITIQMTESP